MTAPRTRDVLRNAGAGLLLAAAFLVPLEELIVGLAGKALPVSATLLGAILLVGILSGGVDASLRPARMPAAVDLVVAAYLVCVVAIQAAGAGSALAAARGMFAAERFIAVYFVARLLALDAVFGERFLRTIVLFGLAVAVFGLWEYHSRWGELLYRADRLWSPRFWEGAVPRLYSLVIDPDGTAYLLYVSLCAAAGAWLAGSRWLPSAVTLAAAVAMPLTLSGSALSAAGGLFAGALGWKPLRPFGAVAVAGSATALGVFLASKTFPRLRPLVETRPAATMQLPSSLAVLLWFAVLAAAMLTAFSAVRGADPSRRSLGAYTIALSSGLAVGSFFLPLFWVAWMHVHLVTPLAILVNLQRREAGVT